MAKSHEEIVALFESNAAAANKPGALKDALDALKEAWSANEQTNVAVIAEKIADAARSCKCISTLSVLWNFCSVP